MELEGGALIVAMLALFWQMHQGNKQSKVHFFTTYTQRYQEIFLNLPVGVESSDFSLNGCEPKEKNEILRWMRAYYDLCSEEFYLNEEGLIDRKVWKLWDKGTKDLLKKPAFIDAWKLVQRHNYFDRRFAQYVKDGQGLSERVSEIGQPVAG